MYPTKDVISRCSYLRDSGDRQEVLREIWEKIKERSVIDYWFYIGAAFVILFMILATIFVLRQKKTTTRR
jgi:spermidine/putrescine transport system substrate-binding protein